MNDGVYEYVCRSSMCRVRTFIDRKPDGSLCPGCYGTAYAPAGDDDA